MAENTSIEWADHTFNPWIGCTKVSPGCDNCYAARQDAFRHWTPEGWGGPRKRTKTWGDPVKWNAQAEREGRRFRVFCASLADVFDNEVPAEWRADLFTLITKTPHLDWLLLTKRIGNVERMLDDIRHGADEDLPVWDYLDTMNVWLGATVVNQEEADRDIPKLLAVPARVRFLSIEPMLGPIDLSSTGFEISLNGLDDPVTTNLHWIIAGGESGPHARPAHPDWFRSLREQCAAADVPFLFKQWGEWTPGENVERQRGVVEVARLWDDQWDRWALNLTTDHGHIDDQPDLYRIGKKAAGRLLDGVEHNGFPS